MVAAQASPPTIPIAYEIGVLVGAVGILFTAFVAELRGSRSDWRKQAQDGVTELAKTSDVLRVAADIAERQSRVTVETVGKIDKMQTTMDDMLRNQSVILRYLDEDRRRLP